MEKVTDQIQKLYDRTAETWQEKVWVNNEEFKQFILNFAELNGSGSMLDVGIGAGDFSGIFNIVDLTGVDISREMLRRCQKLHPNFKLSLADAQMLPFKDDLFDIVCCRNCLQNFENPQPSFVEMLRVTKPGGKLLVVESAVYDEDREFPTEFCRVVEPFHPLFPSHQQLRKIFEDYHLESISQEVTGVRKRWLAKWQLSKGATGKQREEAYRICEQYPKWYKDKYQFEFFPKEVDIESRLTFSLLKGFKKN